MNKLKLILTSIGIGIISILSIVIKSLRMKNESLKNEKQALQEEIKSQRLAREVEKHNAKEQERIKGLSRDEIEEEWVR